MSESLSVSLWMRLAAAALMWGTVAASPSVVWHVRDEGWGTPAADESTVYFTTRRHEVVAVDAQSGHERWRVDTNERGADTLGYGPVVAGSVVAAGDYSVVAFDRATGAFKWRFDPVDGHAPGPYMGAVAGGLLLTGSSGGRLHAIEHETGTRRWSTLVSEERAATVFAPIADGDIVIAGFSEYSTRGSRGGVVAVDLASGDVRWKRLFPLPEDPTLSTISAGGPVVYEGSVIATSGDGIIYAMSRQSGEIQWSLPRVSNAPRPNVLDPKRDYRALAISGSTLVAASLTGVVVGFDLATRTERWRFLDEWLVSSVMRVTADEQVFYLPFFSGVVLALDAATGEQRWRIGDWKAGFIWVPLVWKDRLFVCATRDGLFALNRSHSEPTRGR